MTEHLNNGNRSFTHKAPDTELVSHNGFRNQDEIMSSLHNRGLLSTEVLTGFLRGGEDTIETEGDDQ